MELEHNTIVVTIAFDTKAKADSSMKKIEKHAIKKIIDKLKADGYFQSTELRHNLMNDRYIKSWFIKVVKLENEN